MSFDYFQNLSGSQLGQSFKNTFLSLSEKQQMVNLVCKMDKGGPWVGDTK